MNYVLKFYKYDIITFNMILYVYSPYDVWCRYGDYYIKIIG